MFTTNGFDYINVLDKAADASWLRKEIINNNISNYDTPGFKRQDIDFQSVLKREMGASKYESLDKKVRGLNTHLSDLSPEVYDDSAFFSYRLDKNNVDIDTEQVESASEELRYELLTSAINSEFQRIQAAIK